MTGPTSARLDRNAKASAPVHEAVGANKFAPTNLRGAIGGANKFARNKMCDGIVGANSFAPLRHGDGVVGALFELVVVAEDLGQVAFHELPQAVDRHQVEPSAGPQPGTGVVQ
jgi:hypothetical protein